MRGVVLQHGLGEHAEMLRLTQARHAAWADRWGMRYHANFERNITHRNMYWEKMWLIREELKTLRTGALLLWLDADTLVERPAVNPHTAMPEGYDFGACECFTQEKRRVLNAGVMFLRASPTMRSFFETCWAHGPIPAMDSGIAHPRHDEARINVELETRWPELRVSCLPATWNAFGQILCPDNPVIRAWHNQPSTTTRRRMKTRLAELEPQREAC